MARRLALAGAAGGDARPPDLIITREAGQADGYEFSMNDIRVYRAHTVFGEAYLIPSQLLRRLRYHDYGEGVGVEIGFEPEPDDAWSGTLSAVFQYEVTLNEVEAFAIRFDSRRAAPETDLGGPETPAGDPRAGSPATPTSDVPTPPAATSPGAEASPAREAAAAAPARRERRRRRGQFREE